MLDGVVECDRRENWDSSVFEDRVVFSDLPLVALDFLDYLGNCKCL